MNNPKPTILHISNEHPSFDCRIFYKELISLSKHYNCYLIAGGNSDGMLTTMGKELRPVGVYNGITVIPYPIKLVKNIILRAFRKFFPFIFFPIYDNLCCYKLITLCKKYNITPSLLHYHDLDFSKYAKKLKQYFNCKLIFDCHEFYFSYFFRKLTFGNLKKASKNLLLLKDAVRTADTTISVTRNLDNIISLMNNNQNHAIVYNCSVLPIINNPWDRNGKIVLVHEGTMSFNRGLKLMLELFTDVFFRDRIKLKIVGSISGKELEYFEAKKKEYDIDDSMIELTGWIDYEMLHEHLFGAIGLLFFEKTFNTYYGMPNKLYNYLNAGLPILSTHLAESSEFISNNKIGCIVERNITSIKNGLNEMIINYDYYMNNVINARQVYSWENEEKKLFSIYEILLNQTLEKQEEAIL